MKKVFVLFTVLCMVISCVGCKAANDTDGELNDVLASSSPLDDQKESVEEEVKTPDEAEEILQQLQTTLEDKILKDGCYGNVQVEKTENGTVFRYNSKDVSEWKINRLKMSETAEYLDPSSINYSGLMKRLGEDGVIVVGKAQGERRSYQEKTKYEYSNHEFDAYTITEFKVEKVIYGSVEAKTIQIREEYGPVIEKDCVYLQYPVVHMTQLIDGETVLMFLKKKKNADWYTSVYTQYPLGPDYADYSEEKLTELLDYYRGKDHVYRYGKDPFPVGMTEQNGETVVVATPFTRRWPKSEQSNEEIVEWLSENIVVQLAAKHHIIVWPDGHVNEPKHTLPREAQEAYRAQSDQDNWHWKK